MERRLENYRDVLECFLHAVDLPGADEQDHHSLGVCYSRLSHTTPDWKSMLTKAIESLQRGFYKNPVGYREVHHNVVNSHALALSLSRLGRIDEALDQCRNGLRLEPNNERLMGLRASLDGRSS